MKWTNSFSSELNRNEIFQSAVFYALALDRSLMKMVEQEARMEVFCALIAEGQVSVSAVDISKDESVSNLNLAIKRSNPNQIVCDAAELHLYIAKVNGVWLLDDESLDDTVTDLMKNMIGMKQLRASHKVGEYLKSPPAFDSVHVLVKLPSASKSLKRTRYGEWFPTRSRDEDVILLVIFCFS